MNSEKNEGKTISEKLSNFLYKFRILILSIVGLLILSAVGIGIFTTVKNSINKKDFAYLDELVFSLSKTNDELSEDDVAKYDSILENVVDFTENHKKGAPAARAFMIIASIEFEKDNWSSSREAWVSAANANAKAYTSPICFYNAAVCSEELDEMDKALEFYTKAADQQAFSLKPHALFNIGRINVELENFDLAKTTFQSLVDTYPSDDWADLAKSTLLLLLAEGKIQ